MNVLVFAFWVIYYVTIYGKCEIKMGMGKESFNYEKQNNFGLGHRPIENYRRLLAANPKHRPFFDNSPYPAKLPEGPKMSYYPTPYKNIYQGTKKDGDKRVYNYKFDYEPKVVGHQVFANGLFNCIITHLAVESTDGIPILLRGGVNYRYFTVMIKAKAGNSLTGRVRAYCRRPPDEGIEINAPLI